MYSGYFFDYELLYFYKHYNYNISLFSYIRYDDCQSPHPKSITFLILFLSIKFLINKVYSFVKVIELS